TSNTSTILLVTMILMMISILSFEFEFVREKSNLSEQSRFEKAHRKSLLPSLFLHFCIIAILATTAVISRKSFNDRIFGITVVLWNTVYISTVKPYIMSKVIEWRNS
ncbi:MAG: hypothetical protein U9Q67_02520, partial [Patescibacteria group bacterium]|nr:hypothetical protein [Patescibacteria group bacterium]